MYDVKIPIKTQTVFPKIIIKNMELVKRYLIFQSIYEKREYVPHLTTPPYLFRDNQCRG